MYGMGKAKKTTIYLPDRLKRDIERVAQNERRSEADVIRDAVENSIFERRAYELAVFDEFNAAKAREIIERYSDLNVGLADASIAVLAERYETRDVLTLDERHFRAIRPAPRRRFRILPADA